MNQSELCYSWVNSLLMNSPDDPMIDSIDDFVDGIIILRLVEKLTNLPSRSIILHPTTSEEKISNIKITFG